MSYQSKVNEGFDYNNPDDLRLIEMRNINAFKICLKYLNKAATQVEMPQDFYTGLEWLTDLQEEFTFIHRKMVESFGYARALERERHELCEANAYLTRMSEYYHRILPEYQKAIAELELKNKELQAEVERLQFEINCPPLAKRLLI